MTLEELTALVKEMSEGMPDTEEAMEQYLVDRDLPTPDAVEEFFAKEMLGRVSTKAVFVVGLQLGYEIRVRQE